jgi:hypothetical protein
MRPNQLKGRVIVLGTQRALDVGQPVAVELIELLGAIDGRLVLCLRVESGVTHPGILWRSRRLSILPHAVGKWRNRDARRTWPGQRQPLRARAGWLGPGRL